jgi:hypothetical protein
MIPIKPISVYLAAKVSLSAAIVIDFSGGNEGRFRLDSGGNPSSRRSTWRQSYVLPPLIPKFESHGDRRQTIRHASLQIPISQSALRDAGKLAHKGDMAVEGVQQAKDEHFVVGRVAFGHR